MTPRFSCALNGVTPESIDPALRVTDLTELPPRRRVSSVPTARHGLMLLRRVRESLTIRISFVIPEYDPVRRRALLSRLHAWADPGGVLTTSDRPGQRLVVVCDTLPMLSALSWSDVIHIDFTAYALPFWEYEAETPSADGLLTLPGDAEEIPVACEVTNVGSTAVTTLTLTCGDTQMTFAGLSLAPGGVMTLAYPDSLLCAVAEGESVLMLRTGDSSDLLLADGGVPAAVSATADGDVSTVFHARGRLL